MASILWVPVTFALTSFSLYWLSVNHPAMSSSGNSTIDSSALKFPSSLEELRALSQLLSQYKQEHVAYVFMLFSSAYLFKQTYAIPGSVFMNLLSGALFGLWLGFPLACVLSASGATGCFLLSRFFGKSYIMKYFPAQLKLIQDKIEENTDSLFFFLMFLRLFPITPNWFLNIASPICNVPCHLFFLSVFFGLMPYNFICVQTGCLLSQLTSMDEIFTLWTMVKLFCMAVAALLPGLILKYYHDQRTRLKQAKQPKLLEEEESEMTYSAAEELSDPIQLNGSDVTEETYKTK